MKLSDAFEFFDKRGDGMISFEEVIIAIIFKNSSVMHC